MNNVEKWLTSRKADFEIDYFKNWVILKTFVLQKPIDHFEKSSISENKF